MCTEIEAKLKVDSLPQIEQRLTELGAEFLAEKLQRDCYFDNENSSFKNSDQALRLRQQEIAGRQKNLLTYKGPKQKDNFKKRWEIEVEIGNHKLCEQLLCALGFKRALVLEKNRRSWRLRNCIVALDRLPLLGGFVEIEGPDDEEIARVQKDLGLFNSPHITQSYADLIEAKLRQLGKKEKEVFL
jgi:predicted adenylyl cyclase CyaB